jgi:hypothetical protein
MRNQLLINPIWILGRIFILGFAYISRKFPGDPRLFPSENEEISTPPPFGLLIGIYLFCKNWSTETFRKKDSKKWAVCNTCKAAVCKLILDLMIIEGNK